MRKWREENPEHNREYYRRWLQNNRTLKRRLDREWYEANKDHVRAYNRTPERREAHRLNARYQKAKRKAAKEATVDPITREEWREIKASYLGLCVYCHKSLQRATMDHVVPLNRGGDHSGSNVVPSCRRCNRAKSDKPLVVFLAERRAA